MLDDHGYTCMFYSLSALNLYILALLCSRAQCAVYIHNFYEPCQVLRLIFMILRLYLVQLLMSRRNFGNTHLGRWQSKNYICVCIQGHPNYVLKHASSITIRGGVLFKTHLMNKVNFNYDLFGMISQKWKYVVQMHIIMHCLEFGDKVIFLPMTYNQTQLLYTNWHVLHLLHT